MVFRQESSMIENALETLVQEGSTTPQRLNMESSNVDLLTNGKIVLED
jgi:hypothetical protein